MQLFTHQTQALELTEKFNRCAYYLDMGLGKTFVGSEKLWELNSRVNIVVCQKTKVDDWIDHFTEHYSDDYTILDLTKKKQFQKFREIVDHEDLGDVVGVINYDLLYRRSYFSHISTFTLMLDESSIIQHETSQRSKFILKMHPENVILLSGTPTGGKYENLWSQLRLLGWNISKPLYWATYVDTKWIEVDDSGFKRKVVVGYKNVDRLKRKLAQYGAVFMKSEEVFDLPEKIDIPIMVPVSDAYKKFMKNSYIELDTLNLAEFHDISDYYGNDTTPHIELIGDTTLTKRLYARQLCSQYNKDKLAAFEDLISSTEDSLVTFYNFNEELYALEKICKKLEIETYCVNGSKKEDKEFKACNGRAILFVQYQAGARGLNLQSKCNKVVYFSLTDKWELYEQSKKRIHRIGQDKKCFYYCLMCKGSVEERILETLKMRKDYDDALFEKQYS